LDVLPGLYSTILINSTKSMIEKKLLEKWVNTPWFPLELILFRIMLILQCFF